MSAPLALDTSVAVPLLVRNHRDHDRIVMWLRDRQPVLSGHALVESYSVITRLPPGLRVTPSEAALGLDEAFGPPIVLGADTSRRLPRILADAGIEGGAVYDALVGLAARENGLTLATRDARAKETYDRLDVQVEVVA